MDLDLLIYGEGRLEQPGLNLPREDVVQFAFVLRPLAEVAGERVHPASGKSYAQLWAEFDRASHPMHRVSLFDDRTTGPNPGQIV